MKKILVADDETDVSTLMKARLVKRGYEVVVCADGQEAIDRIPAEKPDLILVDYRMPFMTGDDVCKKVKSDPQLRSIPVVLLTASLEHVTSEEEAKACGFDAYLVKPFDFEELLKIVTRFIG